MIKSKIFTILYILCFLSFNGNAKATESNSETSDAKTMSESKVESTSETVSDDDEKESSTNEDDGDKEPDCD